jgi:hypothetical protein
MNSFFHVTSKDPEKQCHIIKPFTVSKLNSDVLKNGKVRSQEAIEALKKKIININNSREGVLGLCCNNPVNQEYNKTLLNAFRDLFPSVREIKKGGSLTYLELSTEPVLEKNKGWQQLKPYHICKLTSANLIPLNNNYGTTYKAINLIEDCYTSNCDNEDTLTLEGLLKEETNPIEYSYYDDLKMYQSVEDGNLDYIKTYLFKYNKIDKVLTNDDLGNYILHIATRYYKKKVYDLIMAMRPKVNVKNTYGDTPLHIACEYGQTEAINELFKQDAEVNARNKKGMTPLMMAVQFQDKNTKKSNPLNDFRLAPVSIMIKTLLRKGADINMVNNNGENVLHIFVKYGQTSPHFSSIMRMLLDNGVDVSVKDNKGRTALELTDMELIKLNESNAMRKARKFVEEGFQVSTVLETDLTPRELELREIQTMLFNHMIKSDSDKYKGYINVSEIPKGAPIEVLNYVCSGDNPEIQGIEDKVKCELMGGVFTKVKNPTTKVKLELIPESEKEILEQKQKDLYYDKMPDSILERELPEEIKQLNTMNVKGLNNIKSNNNSHIKQVDDEQYIDRDNMLPITDYNTDTNKEIYTNNESFNSIKLISKKNKINKNKQNVAKNYNLIKESNGPPTFYSAKELSETVKDAFRNSNNLMINSKSNISKTEYLNNLIKYLGQNYLGIILMILLIILLLKIMKTF